MEDTMFITYLIIASLGLLSMPSFHAKWKAGHADLSWDYANWKGEWNGIPVFPQPLVLCIGFVTWPLVLAGFILYHSLKVTRLYKIPGLIWYVLATPGRILTGNPPNIKKWLASFRPKRDPFLIEAEQEVDRICLPLWMAEKLDCEVCHGKHMTQSCARG